MLLSGLSVGLTADRLRRRVPGNRFSPGRLAPVAVAPIRRILGRLAVLVIAAIACLPAALAEGHQGNSNFRSVITAITPPGLAEGLKAEVVNFDDHVVLENRSGKDVEILGYNNEPYARIMADGTVEVNLNSPSHYLNEDRFAGVELPERADKDAKPSWNRVGTDGRFEWHDHRSHFMAKGVPPQVTDESVKTKVFDYQIPIRVDGRPAKIEGTLYWNGRETGFPVLPFVLLGVVTVAGLTVVLIRRRRRDPDPTQPD